MWPVQPSLGAQPFAGSGKAIGPMTNAEAIIGGFLEIPQGMKGMERFEARLAWSRQKTDPPIIKYEAINTIGPGKWNEFGVEAWEAWLAGGEGAPLQRVDTTPVQQHAHTR